MAQVRIRLCGTIMQHPDGRWVAEVPDLPGVMGCGPSPDVACDAATTLARRVLAERLDVEVSLPISFGSEKES
jgi:predicted RNase H-like HicB family nuclease